MQTVVGTVIDPMADKTLMTVLTVCLAVKGALPGIYPIISRFYITLATDAELLVPLHFIRFPTSDLSTYIIFYSLARSHNSRSRRWPCDISDLLPLDLPSATQDFCKILGFLVSHLQKSIPRQSANTTQLCSWA